MLPWVKTTNFKYFMEKVFSTFWFCYFYFSIFCRTIENEHFWKSMFFFIWHPLKSDFSESACFHSFALSDCGESISNLRKDTFAKCFCGILFWELFCAGNIFCETVSNFLTLLTTICHTLFTFCPTALYASGKMPSADRLVLKRYSNECPLF